MERENRPHYINEMLDSAVREGKELTLECRGNCMEPFLKDGNRVSFKKTDINKLKRLDLIMFKDREKDGFVTHRFIKTARINGRTFIIAKSDMSEKPDPPIPEEAFLGRITRIEKSNKVLYLDTFRGKMISYINFFIAPLYLKIKAERKEEYFKNENELLTSISKINMDEDSVRRARKLLSEKLDWDYIFNKMNWNFIMPFFVKNVMNTELKNQVPLEIQERTEFIFTQLSQSIPEIRSELKNVLSAFNRSDIKVMVITGAHLSEEIYGDTILRRINDIDILARFEDFTKIRKVLKGLGFQFKEDNYSYWASGYPDNHAHFRRQGVKLEVLFNVWYMDFPFFKNDIWQGAREVTLAGEKTLVPSVEDTLLIGCVNLAAHNYAGLMWLCDIREIINRFEGTIDWDAVIKRSKEKDVDCSVYYSLYYSSELLNYRIPEDIMKRLRPSFIKRKLHNFFWNKKVILWKEEDEPSRANIGYRVQALLFNGKMSFKPRKLLKIFLYIFKVTMPKITYLAKYYEEEKGSFKLLFYYLVRIARFFLVLFDILLAAIFGRKREAPPANAKTGYRLFLRPERSSEGYKIDSKI